MRDSKELPDNANTALGPVRCYAFLEASGSVDVDSIAETEDAVRWKMLEASMGWRFEHPARYDRDEEWKRLLTYGKVVPVSVSAECASAARTEEANARLVAASPDMLNLVVGCYKAIHRDEWEDGETEGELMDRINDTMHSHFGETWRRLVD